MTELERARVHLGLCQDDLYYSRLHLPGSLGACRVAERHFLAALSWVWDAQERAQFAILERRAAIYRSVAGQPLPEYAVSGYLRPVVDAHGSA